MEEFKNILREIIDSNMPEPRLHVIKRLFYFGTKTTSENPLWSQFQSNEKSIIAK